MMFGHHTWLSVRMWELEISVAANIPSGRIQIIAKSRSDNLELLR